MRRILVVALLLAVALLTMAGGHAAAEPSNPCAIDPAEATQPPLTEPGTLNGTSGSDILFGSEGADIINGKGGADIICGGGGADEIDGGTGNDQIEASDGSYVKGGSGKDTIWISGEESVGDGGAGDDTIYASNWATAKGSSGNDAISADAAAAVYGGSGKDFVDNLDNLTPYVDCGSGRDNYTVTWTQQGFGPASQGEEQTIISCEQSVR